MNSIVQEPFNADYEQPYQLRDNREEFRCVNISGETIPAYGVFKIDTSTEIYYRAVKPNADNLFNVLVNGSADIPDGKIFTGYSLSSGFALVDGNPYSGTDVGTVSGQFKLYEGQTGFVTLGSVVGGVARTSPFSSSKGRDTSVVFTIPAAEGYDGKGIRAHYDPLLPSFDPNDPDNTNSEVISVQGYTSIQGLGADVYGDVDTARYVHKYGGQDLGIRVAYIAGEMYMGLEFATDYRSGFTDFGATYFDLVINYQLELSNGYITPITTDHLDSLYSMRSKATYSTKCLSNSYITYHTLPTFTEQEKEDGVYIKAMRVVATGLTLTLSQRTINVVLRKGSRAYLTIRNSIEPLNFEKPRS